MQTYIVNVAWNTISGGRKANGVNGFGGGNPSWKLVVAGVSMLIMEGRN